MEFAQAQKRPTEGDSLGSRIDSNGRHVASPSTEERHWRLQAVGKIASKTRGLGRCMGVGCGLASTGHRRLRERWWRMEPRRNQPPSPQSVRLKIYGTRLRAWSMRARRYQPTCCVSLTPPLLNRSQRDETSPWLAVRCLRWCFFSASSVRNFNLPGSTSRRHHPRTQRYRGDASGTKATHPHHWR